MTLKKLIHVVTMQFFCFLSLDQEVMQDSKSNSVNGNPFMETGIQWLRIFFFSKFFFSKFFFFVIKVARYNTALARFRDNPESMSKIFNDFVSKM